MFLVPFKLFTNDAMIVLPARKYFYFSDKILRTGIHLLKVR